MELNLPAAPGDAGIAVGFSGGMDSTVLLHALAADPGVRARGLRALHVDHGLHADSLRWREHCEAVCAALGLALEFRRVQVTVAGDGLEAAARSARYAAFAQMQRRGEVVALAHHRDDQAETVLLRLLRGAGDGVAAMRPQRRFGDGWLWRPLLAIARAQLEEYAQAAGLRWQDDPSNAALHHDRNFLRHDVLPRLATRWPQAGAGLARSASLLAVQGELLADEEARRLAQLQGLDPATLAIAGLRQQPPAWRDRLLRAWVRDLGLPPLPATALAAIANELLPARDDGDACIHWAGTQLRKWRGMLWAGVAAPALTGDWQPRWDGRGPLPLPGGGSLQLQPAQALADGFAGPLLAHARRGGERITLPGRRHSHSLKHVLQDVGVPPWQRAALPLLSAADGELLAAGDVVISARLHAWLDANRTCLRLLR